MDTIVAIDDNDLELEIISFILSSEQYNVVSLSSGANMIEVCKEVKPVCVLLDLLMPYRSGLELYKELQNCEDTKDIPVIFITGSEDKEEELTKVTKDENSFFSKPVNWHNLLVELKVKSRLYNSKKEMEDIRKELSTIIQTLTTL